MFHRLLILLIAAIFISCASHQTSEVTQNIGREKFTQSGLNR